MRHYVFPSRYKEACTFMGIINEFLMLHIDAVTTDPVVGELFALISDEVWCRVKVTSVINGGKLQVFFVDHGDTTETSKAELRPLAPQFRQLPFQVRFRRT